MFNQKNLFIYNYFVEIIELIFFFLFFSQVIDSAHCKMPDYYIYKAPTCACGDDPVRIPQERRSEGLEAKAHWCVGTLQMTDGFGNPKYVYNPYTYGELRSMMTGKRQYHFVANAHSKT